MGCAVSTLPLPSPPGTDSQQSDTATAPASAIQEGPAEPALRQVQDAGASSSISSPANEAANQGLTLRGIRSLRSLLQRLCGDNFFAAPWDQDGHETPGITSFDQLTTKQVVYTWVRKITGRFRLADLSRASADMQPAPGFAASDIRAPTYFISHAWNGKVSKLLDTIELFLTNAIDTTAVWLDFVAICQNQSADAVVSDSEALKFFVQTFQTVLNTCQGGTLVVIDMQGCNPATRAWCVYEWDHTLHLHGPDGLHMHGMTTAELAAIVRNMDVTTAQCTKATDKATIHRNIVEHHGSLSSFDTALQLQLLLDPLSYKVDLRQLQWRSAGSKWQWREVSRWLQSPAAGRALCVLASEATGKSSISEAMYRELLGRRDHGQPGVWLGPTTAIHLLKYNDQRSLDPVAIVKSLAYQLATRLNTAATAVLAVDVMATVEMYDVEAAFTQLLLPAVCSTTDPVFLLIDALDEADPPEQQRPGFNGLVMACANKTLLLILRHLAARLPSNARFVLTSRPDAACGGIADILQRQFPDITFMHPGQLRGYDASADRMLVAEAVLKEYRARGLPLALSTPTGATPTLHQVYQAAFETAPPMDMAGPSPSSPPDPTSMLSAEALQAHAPQSVHVLLSVLLAAQEPLSHSLLQQMGLSELLPALPGWGVLFYLAQHHVYLLHKSLSDWLLDAGQSGPYSVDTRPGHRLLGTHLIQDVLRPTFSSTSVLSPYTVKYAVHHLCQAMPDTSPLLHAALANWDLLQKVFEAGQGGQMLRSLSSIPAAQLNTYCEDAVRWLGRNLHELEMRPSELGPITLQPYARVVSSAKYREALQRRVDRDAPFEALVLGGTGGRWPPDRITLKGHTKEVNSVAFSSDGRQLATGSDDCTAKIWDLLNGHCSVTLEGHSDLVNSIAFGLNNRCLVTASSDATARVWDLTGGQCIAVLQGHTKAILSCTFSPNGELLATTSRDHTVKLWDATTGQWRCSATLQAHDAPVICAAFSPDNVQLATGGSDNCIKLWDVAGGSCLRTLQGHYDVVRSVAFSPDGTQLASGSDDWTAKLWDVANGNRQAVFEGHTEAVMSVAFSPDGTRLATGSADVSAKLWDLKTNECSQTLQGHNDVVISVAFSHDGQRLATGSDDRTAKIWDLADQSSSEAKGHTAWVRCMAFSPDGKMLATGSDDWTTKLWDITTAKCMATLEGHTNIVLYIAFTCDGKSLVTGSHDNTAKFWSVSNGQCEATLEDHDGAVYGVAFSPCGRHLATGSADRSAKIWDLPGRQCSMTLQGHTDALVRVAFSPDGRCLATCSVDKTAKIWDWAAGMCIATLEGHSDLVSTIAFAPPELGPLLATGSWDTTIKIWDLSVPSPQCTVTLQGLTAKVRSIVFDPSGRHLASNGNDNLAVIWNTSSGEIITTLEGHVETVRGVAFSPDGKLLATSSADCTVKLWDVSGLRRHPDALGLCA